jgi:mannose-6-phosphate isomerase class I
MKSLTPVKLREDNWTPPSRTPWGGRWIRDQLKRGLPRADARPEDIVGESWELSFDPTFPSRLDDHRTLAEVVAEAPASWLGRHAEARSSPILLKLLDAREPLSVQVHPADDDPRLGPTESGKPEAWIVLDRAPGAGLWLGLSAEIDREELARAIEDGDDVSPYLNFVPVEPGDAFLIEAGTVHAIGPGVTLLEPQLVRPGRSGATYRLWDWGRRYDPEGRPSPDGLPRLLHRERALAVTRFDGPRGAAFVASCRAMPRRLPAPHSLVHEHVLSLHELSVERIAGSGLIELPPRDTLVGLTVTRGALTIGDLHARAGETCVIPAVHASEGALRLNLQSSECFLVHLAD